MSLSIWPPGGVSAASGTPTSPTLPLLPGGGGGGPLLGERQGRSPWTQGETEGSGAEPEAPGTGLRAGTGSKWRRGQIELGAEPHHGG